MIRAMILMTILWTAPAIALPVTSRAQLKGPAQGLFRKLLRRASFTEEWSRYPAPDVVLNDLLAKFPAVKFEVLSEQCRQLVDENRIALGDSDPITGAPAMDQPNTAFVKWYVRMPIGVHYEECERFSGEGENSPEGRRCADTYVDAKRLRFGRRLVPRREFEKAHV